MNGDKQGAIVSTADAANGTFVATGQDRLAISFWIWALWDTGTNGFFNDLELRMAEAVERGFNCIRIEGGAGITHDAKGRPRGELEFLAAVPGHTHFTRQMEHMTGGHVDLLRRLIDLCTVAQRYNVNVILSSWYYLHTFWFTDKNLTAELLGLPPEERFMVFARGLDRILEELKQRGLADTIATAEIFNEVDGFFHGKPVETVRKHRRLHEEALDFLKTRHPDIRFSLDTSTPSIDPEIVPRNAQVWTFHSYYLWPVYNVFEQNLMKGDTDLGDPAAYASVRRFLRRDLIPFQAILSSREGRPPIMPGWFRRIWLYRNLDPNAMPELERLLREHLEKNLDLYKQKATDAVEQAVKLREELLPGVPLVVGEGASYCADHRLRWEERSDAYWE
ncbi:MAG: hypothetical protein MUC88_25485, partial [Planctomycetes bacterium]|nr:hypothetical protein [Planctomycetota bacterium]